MSSFVSLEKHTLSAQQQLLLNSLDQFYGKTKIDTILPILQGTTKLSLRIIDWFVTNYSKKNNTSYVINKTKNGKDVQENFIVHLRYKDQLKAYSKKQFDPFCRRERIQYKFNDQGNYLLTTVGQLNFFRWALENNVIDFIRENIKIIDKDMNTNIRKHYKSKKKTKSPSGKKNTERRKRRELSTSATKSLTRHAVNIVLDFD